MKIIELSNKKFSTLSHLKIYKGVFNTEAEMFLMDYKRQTKVVKSLYHQSGEVFANKLYTVEMLDANKEYLPDNFVVPDALLSVNRQVVGFTIPYIESTNLSTILRDSTISPREQIYYLKKIGNILEQLEAIRKHREGLKLYIGDLHESNFLVNPDKRDISVIDLDSCKIKDNSSFVSRYLTPASLFNEFRLSHKYQLDNGGLGYAKIDANTDLYCYIMTIFNYLYGSSINNMKLDEFYNYLSYLDSLGINKDLLHALISIVYNKDNDNPVNYLNSLTDEQIYRSRHFVYNKVKK